MNHLLFKYLWFRACAILNFHCFHNPVVIKEWPWPCVRAWRPCFLCLSVPLYWHMCGMVMNTLWLCLMQDIDYSHMTAGPFSLPPLCPTFVLLLWNCVFNQSHPIYMEISIWQLSPFKINTRMLLRAHCEVCFTYTKPLRVTFSMSNTTQLFP